ncbi:MAG: hypothetical protein ACTSRG_20240 [Candidatus Helarchaeota archaeon]
MAVSIEDINQIEKELRMAYEEKKDTIDDIMKYGIAKCIVDLNIKRKSF